KCGSPLLNEKPLDFRHKFHFCYPVKLLHLLLTNPRGPAPLPQCHDRFVSRQRKRPTASAFRIGVRLNETPSRVVQTLTSLATRRGAFLSHASDSAAGNTNGSTGGARAEPGSSRHGDVGR